MPKEEKKEIYEIRDVATQTEAVIYNAETKETYTALQAMVKIMNDIEKLKKLLG